jgi:nicotinate-nucleotide pyrophosphorylase (carboxylating)
MIVGVAVTADLLIRLELEADLGDGDRTSEWTIPAEAAGEAWITAKEDGVVCGVGIASRVFETVDAAVDVVERFDDGARVIPGDRVLGISGSLRSILAAERTALNFLARLSGIATLTGRYVETIAGTGCRVADTRTAGVRWKSTPSLRAAA